MNEPKVRILTQNEIIDFPTLLDILKDIKQTMKKYLALDLETTGLDPKNDTIIEIAVICFHLERHGNTYEYIIDDERHMLLDPERPISPEFSLITGIQESLLRGKKTWDEVRESIQDFFDTWQDATLV